MSKARRLWTDHDDNYIIEHREEMTARDFAAHFGVSVDAVEARCKRRKISIDAPHKRRMRPKSKPNPKMQQAKDLRKTGLAYRVVENKTGIDKANLCRAMKNPNQPESNPSLIKQIIVSTMMNGKRDKAI